MQEYGETLEKTENDAYEHNKIQFKEYLDLGLRVYKLIGSVLSAQPECKVSGLSQSFKVTSNLICRISNDLNVIHHLVLLGYPVQAATVASSMYEVALTIAYIGSDDIVADKWIEHGNILKSFETISNCTEHGMGKMGCDEADQLKKLYQVYTQLCGIKHANSNFCKQLHLEISNGNLELKNGPDTSQNGEHVSRYVFEHAILLASIAAQSFMKNHLPDGGVKTELLKELNVIYREHDGLNSASKKKYGTVDPFPGKWRKF